jgi:hypothetical protein
VNAVGDQAIDQRIERCQVDAAVGGERRDRVGNDAFQQDGYDLYSSIIV